MPIYSAFFCAFMFASVGLPGMSGFVGEFHALMGAFRGPASFGNLDLYRTVAIISTGVVILSAWYMLWLFQRVAQGTAPGLQLAHAHAGADHGHGGHGSGDHDHHATPTAHSATLADDPAEAAAAGMHLTDVKPREVLTLAPLLALTIIFGVFPGPIFALVSSSLETLLTPFK